MRKLILMLALVVAFLPNGMGAWYIADDWEVENITNSTTGTFAIAIGDADNDGLNETVVGEYNNTNAIYLYKYSGGTWIKSNITNSAETYASSIQIGDTDNDTLNEVAVGYAGMDSAVRMYKHSNWTYGADLIQNGNFSDVRVDNASLPADWYQNDWSDCSFEGDTAEWNFSQIGYNGNVANVTWTGIDVELASTPILLEGGKTYHISLDFFPYSEPNSTEAMYLVVNDSACTTPETTPQLIWNSTDVITIDSHGFSDVAITSIGGGWFRATGILSTALFGTNYTRLFFVGGQYADLESNFSLDNVVLKEVITTGGWTETNITTINRNVTSIAIGDGNNNKRKDIIVGMLGDGTGNNTRLYENTSGGWVEQNISLEALSSYDVASVLSGNLYNSNYNVTIVAFTQAPVHIRAYRNTTGKWVEYNISKDVNVSYDQRGLAGLWLGQGDNSGKNKLYGESTWYKDGVYYVTLKQYYCLTVSVCAGTVLAGFLTNFPDSVYGGDIDNDGYNEIAYVVSASIRYLRNTTSAYWQQSLIGQTGSAVRYINIGDGDNDGKNNIFGTKKVITEGFSDTWNLVKYTKKAETGEGGAMDLSCVKMGNDKKYCIGDVSDYLCIKNNCVVI